MRSVAVVYHNTSAALSVGNGDGLRLGLYLDRGGAAGLYYVVTAQNAAGESGPSNTAQARGIAPLRPYWPDPLLLLPAPLLLLALGRSRRRKWAAPVGAALLGVAAVCLGAGLQRSAYRDLGSIGDLTRITVSSPYSLRAFGVSSSQLGDEAKLDDQTIAQFRKLPGVVAATPYQWLMGSAMLRLNRLVGGASIVGIDPTQIEHLGFTMASGTARLGPGQALAGARVAENLFDPRTGQPVEQVIEGGRVVAGPVAGQPVAKPPNLQGQSLQLVLSKPGEDGRTVERVVRVRVNGVLAESGGSDDYTVFLALKDVIELNGWLTGQRSNPGRDGYSQVIVKVASVEQVTAVEQEILRQGFYAYSPRSMLQSLNVFFLVIQGIFGGIGAIALIVAAFGIANTMTMAIYERTREIGLMKAVGASNRDVMSVFLAEAGGIGFLGGVGGVLLGVMLGALIDLIAGTYLAAQAVQQGAAASDVNISLIYTPLWLPILAILFALLVGVVSGIYPAMRAAALNPVAALKYE